jgi:hypothetical protein
MTIKTDIYHLTFTIKTRYSAIALSIALFNV